jgi:hypothetical protein
MRHFNETECFVKAVELKSLTAAASWTIVLKKREGLEDWIFPRNEEYRDGM